MMFHLPLNLNKISVRLPRLSDQLFHSIPMVFQTCVPLSWHDTQVGPTAPVERDPPNFPHLSIGEWAGCPLLRASNEHRFTVRVLRTGGRPGYPSLLSKLARFSTGMAPVLVPLRPSSEHILIVRAPGARDQHGCHSAPFIVDALRTRRAEVHGPDCVLDLFQLYDRGQAGPTLQPSP